jgi:hypothetical protein
MDVAFYSMKTYSKLQGVFYIQLFTNLIITRQTRVFSLKKLADIICKFPSGFKLLGCFLKDCCF